MLKRINLDQIRPNPNQPRKVFEHGALMELANSIRENGLVQPITVVPHPDGEGFMIVAGERRWRAHNLLAERDELESPTILAHVRKMDDVEVAILAIVENLARADITPLEEARAFQAMLDTGMEPSELARRLGIEEWTIEQRTRLLKLEPSVLKLFEGGNISPRSAKSIAQLSHQDQSKIVQLMRTGKLASDRAVRTAVETILNKEAQPVFLGCEATANEEEVETLTKMEARVRSVVAMTAAGFKDGECVVAMKVDPTRVTKMIEELELTQKHLTIMIRQLREEEGRQGARLALAS